jgi:hypothetical protein
VPGEIWRQRIQVGKETTPGSAVAATRLVYLDNASIKFTKTREPRYHRFATGTRDNVRAYTSGPVAAGGEAKLPVSGDELLEWLLVGLQGSVTPTTPSGATNARLWTFKPSTTLDSMTIERDDGSGNLSRLSGTRADQIHIAGGVAAANEATITFFAQDREDGWAGPLTGALPQRDPTFLEGWQTRMWLTSFGATPQSVLVPWGVLINWDIRIQNQLGRKYTAMNTKAASAITFGELAVEGTLLLEGNAATTVQELAYWNADTKRLVTLEFLGPANEIEPGINEIQTLSSTATGGTIRLTFAGLQTGTIPFNAAASQVQTALNALANVQVGSTLGVTCTGGPLPTPVVCTFVGPLAAQQIPNMTVDNTAATGGVASVAETTPGRSGGRYVAIDLPGTWSSPDTDQEDANTRAYSFPYSYVYDSTNAFGVQVRVQTNRTAAFA